MTQEQREDLFVEWSLYEPTRQKETVEEYLDICHGHYSQDGFLAYLKDKLQIEGYWRLVGLFKGKGCNPPTLLFFKRAGVKFSH